MLDKCWLKFFWVLNMRTVWCRFSTETAIVKVERSSFGAPLETSPALWMTNVTIQGNGEGNVRGLQVSSRVYAEGQNPLLCCACACCVVKCFEMLLSVNYLCRRAACPKNHGNHEMLTFSGSIRSCLQIIIFWNKHLIETSVTYHLDHHREARNSLMPCRLHVSKSGGRSAGS
jgi:hypothetical protein